MDVDQRRTAPMKQTLQFLGLMACGLLVAGVAMLLVQAFGGSGAVIPGARSAAGIDYMSFGIGLALGLMMAEVARLSWSDMPRRAIAWVLANRRNAKYCGYACVWIAVLIYV
jgi:hypothetical protein